nr:uncharacterized protein LOC117275371 [Nicotiana tomentosiformis]
MVGLPVHLWCLDLFKKIGEICGVFIDVTCSLHDLSRVRIVVRKGGRIPVSTVVEDGTLSYRVWLSPEFRPIFMPVIATEEKGRSNRREGRGKQSLRGGEGSPDHWIKSEADVRSRRDGGFEIGGGRQNYNRRRRREWVSEAGWKSRMGRSSSTCHRAGKVFSKYRPGPPHMGPTTFPNSIRIDPKGPVYFKLRMARLLSIWEQSFLLPLAMVLHTVAFLHRALVTCAPLRWPLLQGQNRLTMVLSIHGPPLLMDPVPSTPHLLLGLVVLRPHLKFLLLLG